MHEIVAVKEINVSVLHNLDGKNEASDRSRSPGGL